MLRNRKEVNAGNLDGVHRDANTIKLKLGTFQTLTNWTAAGIGSIKKKRGVELVIGVPTPPTPPGGGVCPDEIEMTGIHDGFTLIGNDSVALFRATAPDHNLAIYRGSTGGSPFLTVFDMDDMVVLADGAGNGYYINADPAVDLVTGEIYAFRRTLVGSNVRLAIWDKDDLSLVSEGPDFVTGGPALTDLKIGTNYIYAATSGGAVLIFDKATLTLQTTVTASDANHSIQSIVLDDNDNAWGMTRQRGGFATQNLLMKINSGGTVTDYDLTTDMGDPAIGPAITFDSSLNVIVMWNSGEGLLGKFDITSGSILNPATDVIAWSYTVYAEFNNYAYNGTFWHMIGSTGFAEFDIATMTDGTPTLWADVVGQHAISAMGRFIFMPSLNCLHVSHGTYPSYPLGGVDRLCFPCP